MKLACFLDVDTIETYIAYAEVMANNTNNRTIFKCGKEIKVFLKSKISQLDKEYRNKGVSRDV